VLLAGARLGGVRASPVAWPSVYRRGQPGGVRHRTAGDHTIAEMLVGVRLVFAMFAFVWSGLLLHLWLGLYVSGALQRGEARVTPYVGSVSLWRASSRMGLELQGLPPRLSQPVSGEVGHSNVWRRLHLLHSVVCPERRGLRGKARRYRVMGNVSLLSLGGDAHG
jgi:hypothetical protein